MHEPTGADEGGARGERDGRRATATALPKRGSCKNTDDFKFNFRVIISTCGEIYPGAPCRVASV